ncbi:MAG TPA: YidC/Oxa1 family membrane protein insertase [Ktedonobacteraceae bacterium]|nr:YidC/Oxa1 family membrane protein insertase [Ktedonobacteraceae bacterium]
MGQIGYLFNLIFTFPIFNILMVLYHLFGDFGLSIIVLTLIVRLVLFPLTLKQLQSTKATQVIQPQIAEIRKKYKNQQEQAVALQALYKEYNVNPLAGCLPTLVQFPVLYGLFFALNAVLRNAKNVADINNIIYPFLPHFVKFPDLNLNWFTWINSSWYFPLNHTDPTHILPIIAGVATFIQLRMAQPRATATSKDMMTQQMQTMGLIMPFFTIFLGWTFPAGLALYWCTTTMFSIVQQYFITGWGSLTVMPPILEGLLGRKDQHKSRGTKVAVNDQRFIKDVEKPQKRVVEGSTSDALDGTDDDSTTASNAGSSNGSSYKNGNSNGSGEYTLKRRPKGGSASARRRGNNPKRSMSRG